MKLPIAKLKTNPDNPRLIKDEKYQRLLQSLKDFPDMAAVREVVINKDNMILGGNMRFKAMVEAGWKEIPVKQVDWPEDKQKEFIIKDNANFGEWDWDIIANQYELEDLDAWGVDLPIHLQSEDEVVEDEAPPVADVAVSKLGEIYQLGRHRLMCGDSTVKENVDLLMDGKKADMVFTDPPYGVDYSGGTQFKKSGKVEKSNRERLINDDSPEIYDSSVPIMAELTKGPVYTWFGSSKAINIFRAVLQLGEIHSIIVWVKGGGSNETNVWEITKDGRNEHHPTQKPIEVCAKAIRNHSGEIVLDLFGGSGSTLIACEQLDRTCYMMELDPKYCDVIRKRYWKFVNGSEEGWEDGTPIIERELSEVKSG